MPGDGKGLTVIVEAFRRAMVDVLVPEIRTMQKQLDEHSGILKEHSGILKEHSAILKEHSRTLDDLRMGQERILERLDVLPRMVRIEARLDQLEAHRA